MLSDILRSLRLGIINLLGVTVPGLIVILLIALGFLAPLMTLIVVYSAGGNSRPLLSLFYIEDAPLWLMSTVVVIVAYIIGYVFRLSTADDLDRLSTERVLKKMGGTKAAEDDHWPHRGESENKFPYFHFKDYLAHRKHKDLLDYITWNKDMRSKTIVNYMKLDTSIRSPHLSATIESNEAHIRLLFGTWHAMRLCFGFVGLGLLISIFGLIKFYIDEKVTFIIYLISGLFLAVGSMYIIKRIENLFHYRRVRELFDIVACYHLAICGFDSAGRPKMGEKENAKIE